METRNLAIMLTDIKGFTSKTAGSSRAQTQELLTRHRDLVLPVILKFHGRLVKTIGDAFLVAFDSPTDAVLCGVEVQETLKTHNADKDHPEKIEIRIAINSGEVAIHDDGDIYGEPVNITARLESIAEAGEVFFTEAVYLAMNKKEVPSSEIGYRQFKGITDKIKVYRVLRETPIGANAAELRADPAHGAAAAPAPVAAPAPAAAPIVSASRRRRLASLVLDIIVMGLAMKALGFTSCGPKARIERADRLDGREVAVKKVTLDKSGIIIKSDSGELVSITSGGGVNITGPAHPKGKLIRTETIDSGWDTGREASTAAAKLVKALLWVFYCGVMMWRFGGTAGMKIMRLKAVDAGTGAPLGADKSFLRAAFSLVSWAAAGLGVVWALWEKDRLTWHDLVAHTRIIDAR